MALAGRQCAVSALNDVTPWAMLWTFDLTSRAVAICIPLQLGDFVRPSIAVSEDIPLPPMFARLLRVMVVSVIGAIILTILEELWGLWDPFGKGLNTYSWTLGVAKEIDTMLNEFYESDDNVIVRKHSYFCPNIEENSPCSWANSFASRRNVSSSDRLTDETGSSQGRPQTV